MKYNDNQEQNIMENMFFALKGYHIGIRDERFPIANLILTRFSEKEVNEEKKQEEEE